MMADYLILTTIGKFKKLLEASDSEEFNKRLSFGRVIKPLRYRNPSLQNSLSFKEGHPVMIIRDIHDKEKKRYKSLFLKGEFCKLRELRTTQRDDGKRIAEIELLDKKGFFQQLIAAGFEMANEFEVRGSFRA